MEENMIALELQLGDIIQITNPVNELLDGQVFFIDYIDKQKVYLVNSESLQRIKVPIDDRGILGDGGITRIDILSRADTPSYAKQNGLLPGKWVNLFFGGDFPVIITGEITNLENDMIEIITPERDVLYINFDYKGIPEDLPIDNIEIREKPSTLEPFEENPPVAFDDLQVLQEDSSSGLQYLPKTVNVEELQLNVPVTHVRNQIREFIVRADQIKFNDETLGPIVQYVDVSSKIQRYSIETQVADLLDDLLSTIPSAQRTPRVLNNIHITIERFKQLRESFSTFDNYGNVTGPVVKTAAYKPLRDWLSKFNHNLYWILPVVKNIKKIYNLTEHEEEENNDMITLNIKEDIEHMNQIIQTHQSTITDNNTNKYASLYSELNPFFTPFSPLGDENTSDVLIETEVQNNINAIINNLEDMYSSVFKNNSIRNRRFVMTRYNMGQSKLDTIETDVGNNKTITVRVPMTRNDLMSVHSIMTLPEPTIRFSKINLPNTDLLSKVNLNQVFLNYWQLLKTKTTVNNVLIDSLDTNIEFDEATFANGVRNYLLNLPADEWRESSRLEMYNKFTNIIVPKTRVLFKLMKKYIHGKLSIVDVVSYLEPFLIYSDDLTFKQYQDIVRFIDMKISGYNKNMIDFSRIFKILTSLHSASIMPFKAFPVLEIIDANLRKEILEDSYRVINNEKSYTNSEMLHQISLLDNSKLYTSGIAYQSLSLMYPKDISTVFDVELKMNKEEMKEAEKQATCETITIAKMYTSIEQIENDNNVPIYFDKKYDKTNYGVMEDMNGYAKQVMSLTVDSLRDFIINDQMKRNQLSETEAAYLADTLINGNKMVRDGQYALLYKGYSENIQDETDYYVRKDNVWVLDDKISKTVITDEPSVFCDLQEKCMDVTTKLGNKCENSQMNELGLQNALLTNVINEFDNKYKQSKTAFEKEIKTQFEYFLSIIPIVRKIQTNFALKYNNQQYKLGVQTEDTVNDAVVSPFTPLLNIILSQKDFTKKQHDIIRFVDRFTRPSIPNTPETEHWLYCIKTGACLVPSFKKELACAFIKSQYEYQSQLETVKSRIGQLSDDGNWWTDKYTGWPICPGDFDTEEGYDDGFKIVSRALMEEDAGNRIHAVAPPVVKYITLEAVMINNIVNALSVAMGITIESQKEFIINTVLEIIKKTVESEEAYKEKIKVAAQKGKNIQSYRDFYNTSILFYTLGAFLIAIQTVIPSLKTRKTHPGCVRSFSGYPFEGQGDNSCLEYVSCIVYDIRSSVEPWNVLKKVNVEKIQTRIRAVVDQFFLPLPEVQRKFEEKTQYLLTMPAQEIPEEHDVRNWSEFLPPLVPFRIQHLQNISEEFRKKLVSDIHSGSNAQREKILVVESKIVQFSLAIQEKIQNVVKSHKALLYTANNEPYLENSCCDSSFRETTSDFFAKKSADIVEYNHTIQKLTYLLEDIRAITEPVLFSSNINAKNKYPAISPAFDEKTIYLAFIFYCKFKSLLPIPDMLLPLCTTKPDPNYLDSTDTIENIIYKLKEDGRNYTNAECVRLLQLVSRENIIHIELNDPVISSVVKLSNLVESIDEDPVDNELVENSLQELLFQTIRTFDVATETLKPAVKNLKDFLIQSNTEMTDAVVEFVQNNRGDFITTSMIRKFTETMKHLSVWNYADGENAKISNDAMYNVVNFHKTFLSNFVNIFPNIILNKVNYDNITIPNYFKFTFNHATKLQNDVAKYFQKLKPFYGVNTLTNVLTKIQTAGKNLVKLSQQTPCFTNVKMGDEILKGVFDDDTSRYLFQYYVLCSLIGYVSLTDRNDMIVSEVQKNTVVNDIVAVEYMDEVETKIDVSISNRMNQNMQILSGNKRMLKQKTAELLVTFMEIYKSEREIVDFTYTDIQDMVFKLKEREKDMITDKLKALTDESRTLDTAFKMVKMGNYSKGSQKGLTVYDKDFYEEEQNLRDEMVKAEQKIRSKNKYATDENIDILLDEHFEQMAAENDIDRDVYDMSYMNETYYDGNTDGVYAPEEEYDDYADEF
jgi:hypothetical protein